MSEEQRPRGLPKLASTRRKPIGTQKSLYETALLTPGQKLPLVVQPATEGVLLGAWLRSNRDFMSEKLTEHGGLLFRGFGITSATEFEECVASLGSDLLDYTYASTPRRRVSGKIYTSTEYPADQTIPLHNEMAYARSWPMKLWFFCQIAPASRGQTPLADSRKVTARISAATIARFTQRGVMYVRNYGHGLDLPWQQVFDTNDRREVERTCLELGIEFEWRDNDCLTTRQVCQAVAAHPGTGEPLWFNQAHLFHVSALDEHIRGSLVATFGEDNLPRNAFFGDGTALAPDDLDEVRRAFESETITFDWKTGDVLLIDNMLSAHGRAPFEGERQILVGMTEKESAPRLEIR